MPDNETITRAAIRLEGVIYTGLRHGLIMEEIWRKYPGTYIAAMSQGFLTSQNRFVSREEAGMIAFRARQTGSLKPRLTSEHIWPDAD